MLADEPLLVTLLLHLPTSTAMSCIASSLQLFFVFIALSPKTGSMSSKCAVCFLHSTIQPSHPSDVFREGKKKKKGYIWDNRGRKGMYTQHPEANIKHYTHTNCTLSQNTVMLEIRMAFHANRGACCAGDRLVLQKELKWKTNPILNKNTTWQGLAALSQTEERCSPRDKRAHVKYTY